MDKIEDLQKRIDLSIQETINQKNYYTTLEVLSGDTFRYEICKYISPRDIYHIGLTCKNLQNIYKIPYIHQNLLPAAGVSQIEARLYSIFQDKTLDFLKALNDSDGVISGGFVLQCLVG